MITPRFFQLPHITVVDVTGNDAATIVHNLTTNDVKSLELGAGCECFFTDVRGKTLAHVYVYREDGFLRLIGPFGQSERIVAHIDRYTIREDATSTISDNDFRAIILPPTVACVICGELNQADDSSGDIRLQKGTFNQGLLEAGAYPVDWLGKGTVVLLSPRNSIDRICETLTADSVTELTELTGAGDESHFHRARTVVGFPWFGIDLDETNLPQEADRDVFAISFTKGCYLGQETVARLDALGQIQKKLVQWKITGGVPDVGTKLFSGEKNVGRLTSVAEDGKGGAWAIGMARRSHFDAGATATAPAEADKPALTATVL